MKKKQTKPKLPSLKPRQQSRASKDLQLKKFLRFVKLHKEMYFLLPEIFTFNGVFPTTESRYLEFSFRQFTVQLHAQANVYMDKGFITSGDFLNYIVKISDK